MIKIDLKKQRKHLYQASAKKEAVVAVPSMNFLMLNGTGDPNTSAAYQQAVEALFTISYTLKFMVKKSDLAVDYGVMPLEGLWWTDDMNDFSPERKDLWQWTAMIMQPEFVTPALVAQACAQAAQKKELPALTELRFETFEEGQAAQLLHLGPYAKEAPTIRRLHAFIKAQGGTLTGKHHEIYLSDPRRAAPEKLKTIIRQPFAIEG